MRIHLRLYCCWIAVVIIGACGPDATPTQKSDAPEALTIQDLSYPYESGPLISAHRGGRYINGHPENCLETFQYLADRHFFIIECDIAVTSDGVLILMHDNTLDRTTTGTGNVKERSWEQLVSLKLKDHSGAATQFQIPLFEDVLKWAPGNALLSLDVKTGVDGHALIKLLEQYNAHEFCEIITYSTGSAEFYHRNAPEYMLSVNVRSNDELQRMLSADVNLTRIKPFIGTRRPDMDFIKMLHNKGMLVTLGVLGNLDQQAQSRGFRIYRELTDMGVDALATDYPIEVAEYYFH